MLVIHIGEHHKHVDGVNPQIIPVPLMTSNTFTPLFPQTRGRMSRFEWQSGGVSLRTGRPGRGPIGQAPTSSQNQRPGVQSGGLDVFLCSFPKAPRRSEVRVGKDLVKAGQEPEAGDKCTKVRAWIGGLGRG